VRAYILASFFSALVGASCSYVEVIEVREQKPGVPLVDSLTPTPQAERIHCDDILGTAFRSEDERRWFGEECTDWPLVAPAYRAPRSGQFQGGGEARNAAPGERSSCARDSRHGVPQRERERVVPCELHRRAGRRRFPG
jgi:hypothetical protein